MIKLYAVLLNSEFLATVLPKHIKQLRLFTADPFTIGKDVKAIIILLQDLISKFDDFYIAAELTMVKLRKVMNKPSQLWDEDTKTAFAYLEKQLNELRERLNHAWFEPKGKEKEGKELQEDFLLDFRKVPIFPTSEEILLPQRQCRIPTNLIEGQYQNATKYLATHFHLLREDCISPLRTGIHAYLRGTIPLINFLVTLFCCFTPSCLL